MVETRPLSGLQPAGVRRRRAAREDEQLIAVAVAHVTQCPYCIRSHTRLARRRGATEEEVMEAICRRRDARGGAYAHAVIALEALEPRGEQTSG